MKCNCCNTSLHFCFTIKQDQSLGRDKSFVFGKRLNYNNWYIPRHQTILLCPLLAANLCHVTEGMILTECHTQTQFKNNTKKVYINNSELWSFEASYRGIFDIFQIYSSIDQKRPKIFCTNFSMHTISEDEYQHLCILLCLNT